MSATSGLYVPGATWLYRLDPRTRLVFALALLLASMTGADLAVPAAVIALTHLILLLGGVGWRAIIRAWRLLIPLLLAIMVLQPLIYTGDGRVVWQWSGISIEDAGLRTGLIYALRVCAAAFSSLIPLLTTPLHLLVRSLQKLGLPYRWGMMIGLAVHYLGTLGTKYSSILEAQQARGLDLAGRGLLKRARAFVPVLVALVIASLRLSDTLSLGLAARGFGMPGPRTYLYDLRLRWADWLTLGLCAGMVLLAILTAIG